MRKYGDIKPDDLCDALYTLTVPALAEWTEEQRTRLYNAAGAAIAAVRRHRAAQSKALADQRERERPAETAQRESAAPSRKSKTERRSAATADR